MALDITIKEFPARHLTGMVMRTDMQKAAIDCPALWETFAPRLVSLTNSENISEAYGVSVMVGTDDTFDYWVTAETTADAPVPEEMKTFELPAGLYACTLAPNLEQMDATYRKLYEEWPSQQSEYTVDKRIICVEVYVNNWQPSEPFELRVPVDQNG